jgi:hypothetical protein
MLPLPAQKNGPFRVRRRRRPVPFAVIIGANTVRLTKNDQRNVTVRKRLAKTETLTENPCVGGSIPPLTTRFR